MERQNMEGLWLPRTDIEGWRVSGGRVSFDHLNPGPVAEIEVELDSIGCLASGSLTLVVGQPWRAYGAELLVELLSESRGWVPVARGCIPAATPKERRQWTLPLEPLENRDLDGYHDGLLTAYNMLGDFEVDWKTTNRQVVEHLLKRSPTASIGVDWAGRVLIAAPEHGSPVLLRSQDFFEWTEQPLEVLDYATEARWDGGKGWQKGEYQGIVRELCVPRKSMDAGEVKFEDRVGPVGPPLVAMREVGWNVREIDGEQLSVDEAGTFYEAELKAPRNRPLRRSVVAEQYAAVAVYDVQTWFERSALAATAGDSTEVKKLLETMDLLRQSAETAAEMLGEQHAVTLENLTQLADAENALRLMRLQEKVESDYEPLSAKVSFGFVKKSDGARRGLASYVVTGLSVWLSTQPWDVQAVGAPLPSSQPNPDSDAPLTTELDTPVPDTEGRGIIHPFASPHTIKVSESDLRELSDSSLGMPWQSSPLTIPEQYFRTPLAAALAGLMDAKWREEQEQLELEREAAGTLPDVQRGAGLPLLHTFPPGSVIEGEVPAGMTLQGGVLTGRPTTSGEYTLTVDGQSWTLWVREPPPSRAWNGRWYLHVAAWWQVVDEGGGNGS